MLMLLGILLLRQNPLMNLVGVLALVRVYMLFEKITLA